MASLLDALDEPITHEALVEMGFRQSFYTGAIDARYNFASMTDEEKIRFVNENIYYTKTIVANRKQVNIYYYPDSFCLERTTVKYVSPEGFELDIKDTFGYDSVISYREPYNIEAVQVGLSSSIYSNKMSGFPMQQYAIDKLDLRDFIFSVEQRIDEKCYEVDLDSLASDYKTYC